MRVLLVRSKPHGVDREDQFLNGIASIGWPAGADLRQKQKDEMEKILKNRYPDVKKLHVTEVHLFVTLPIHSIIITPSLKNPLDIHIFRTTSECEYIEEWDNDNVGNPHTIQIKHLKTILKTDFSDYVQRAIRSAVRAVCNFSQYQNEIAELVKIERPEPSQIKSIEENILYKKKALETLVDLLDSKNDEIRLKAATALLTHDSSV